MKPLFVFAFVFALGASLLHAEVAVPNVFSDHMVLQRDLEVPIWGSAAAGEKITVKFRDQEKSATADKEGSWRLKLEKLEAGGPDTLTISGSNTIEIVDVLVGEVWVGSGQSNMAGGAAGYAKNDPTLAKVLEGAPYPNLRLLRSSGAPGGAKWSESTPAAAQGFSALLLAFGERLHRDLDVPVGLIVGAVGGTPSGSWLSQEALANDAAAQAQIAEFAKTWDGDAAQKKHEEALKKWEDLKAKIEAEPLDKDGKKKRIPRKPNAPVGPGKGTRGETGNLYERFIRPVVGYGIRGVLWDQGESGTAIQGVDQHATMGALITGWRKEWAQNEFPFVYVQKPSGGGVAWDFDDPVTREADKITAVPASNPGAGNGSYREHHIGIRNHPNTWMATASDLGPKVHPLNKWGYGQRAAQVALHAAYGQDVPVYGPSYESHAVEGAKIRVKLRDVGSGLAFKHADSLQGFQVAGEDKVFHWATAEIDGEAVVVSSAEVAKPVAVRYAWAQVHPWANLFSKNGLPALTFRSDDW